MSPKAKAATADAASSSDSDDADETGILKKDLKWRPGLSGHEAKLRAKQLREASVKRSLEKKVQQEAQRQASKQEDTPAGATSSSGEPLVDVSDTQNNSAAHDEEGDADAAAAVEALETLPADMWIDIMESGWLDALTICALGCSCSELAELVKRPELWDILQRRTFGPPETLAELPGFIHWRAHEARKRCVSSEAELDGWRRAGRPTELALPGMTSVSIGLDGGLGVSTHEGRMTRLWEAKSGRRLACHQHKSKATLTCCDASGNLAAVGDSAGMIHVFDMSHDDDGFAPTHTFNANPDAEFNALYSVAILPESERPTLMACYADGLVRIWGYNGHTWGGSHLPGNRLGCVTAGGNGDVFFASRNPGLSIRVQQFDNDLTEVVWEASTDEFEDVETMIAGLNVQHESPRALMSYSMGWQLLATVTTGGCQLWDTRSRPHAGVVARVRLPSQAQPHSVHLDPGGGDWGGGGAWGGNLFLSSRGGNGGVHLYDIRSVRAEHSGATRVVDTCCAPMAPRGRGAAVACFAANAEVLVAGGGAKSTCAWQWRRGGNAGAASGSSGDGGADESPTSGARKEQKEKPRRQAHTKNHSRASRPQ